jgi:hypothetical protein
MTHELFDMLPQLREAGFPFRMEDGEHRIPTLSELIEALNLFSEFSLEQHSNDWRAGIYRKSRRFPNKICFSGKTPEEAVAKLWLALKSDEPKSLPITSH